MNEPITFNGIALKFKCDTFNVDEKIMNEVIKDFCAIVSSADHIREKTLKRAGGLTYEVCVDYIFNNIGKYDPKFSINIIKKEVQK